MNLLQSKEVDNASWQNSNKIDSAMCGGYDKQLIELNANEKLGNLIHIGLLDFFSSVACKGAESINKRWLSIKV